MRNEIQISAYVSKTTKELLEKHVKAMGVKKGHLIEIALRHHLQALQELPTDVLIHPKIVVSRRSGDKILARVGSRKPTARLRELLTRRGD